MIQNQIISETFQYVAPFLHFTRLFTMLRKCLKLWNHFSVVCMSRIFDVTQFLSMLSYVCDIVHLCPSAFFQGTVNSYTDATNHSERHKFRSNFERGKEMHGHEFNHVGHLEIFFVLVHNFWFHWFTNSYTKSVATLQAKYLSLFLKQWCFDTFF